MATIEEIKDVPNHPEVYLIDVRCKDEIVGTGTIPGSINIPCLPDDEFQAILKRSKPSKGAPLIFTCYSGARALRAVDLAIEAGFTNAKPYLGSWSEWSQLAHVI